MTTTLRPGTLLLSLYGAYLRELGGWAAVADLITLMGDLEVAPPSVRSAISRMKKAGTLAAEQRDGVAGYALTEEALAMLRDGDQLIYQSTQPATGGWTMVVYSVPETERARRHELRTRLGRLGFGQLSAGVWIAPDAAADRLAMMLRRTGLERYVTTWTARPEDPASIEARIHDAWDLEALAGGYRAFIAECGPTLTGVVDDRTAFTTYLRLLSRWRRLPFMDPGLPASLLPASWPGGEARRLFTQARDTLEAAGRRHVVATVRVTAVGSAP